MPETPPRPRFARKLLSASLGVATISYVTATASCGSSDDIGNRTPGPVDGASSGSGTGASSGSGTGSSSGSGAGASSGSTMDGSADASSSDVVLGDFDRIVVGNLVAIPIDAEAGGTSADATTTDANLDATHGTDAVFEHFVGNLAPPAQDP